MDLHVGRTWSVVAMGGMIPHPIGIVELVTWLDLHQFEDAEERQEISELVRELDVEYLAWVARPKPSACVEETNATG